MTTETKSETKLSTQTMQELGFVSKWPGGNPKEPWWKNEALDVIFFGLPTAQEFFQSIQDQAERKGKEAVQGAIKSALNL